MRKITQLLTLFILLGFTSVNAQLNILSGLKGGTYEALANDIKGASKQDITVLNSEGSVDNYNQLINLDNNIYVTFMQYDVLLANELQNPDLRKDLRVLLPLFLDEEIHIITKKGSKIDDLKDLRGKKVAVGVRGQGTFVTAQTIKQRTSTAWVDVEMNSNDAYQALMKGEIDAYFYVGGKPIASLFDLGKDAPIKLVNIKSSSLDDIYMAKKIKKGTYPWQTENVSTYAVATMLMVNIHNMSRDTQRKLNMLLTDTENGLKAFQKTGHPKWKDVYTKNQAMDWPYYYLRPVVD
jgi:TRAP transporter TAXI family solute receptor